MKQERVEKKRRRTEADENKTQRPDTGGQKASRGQGQQSSKSGQGPMGQPGSSAPNRPMDVDEEEEEIRNAQRKGA